MQRIDPIVNAINNLMRTRGGTGTLITKTAAQYDPATSTVVATKVETPVQVLVFDYIRKEDGDKTKGATIIEQADKQIFVKAGNGVPYPKPGSSELVIGDNTYRVFTTKEHNPSGVNPLLYEVMASK